MASMEGINRFKSPWPYSPRAPSLAPKPSHAVARITATLADIDQSHWNHHMAVRLAVENLTERMHSACISWISVCAKKT
jgi:hypothetical protein